MSRSLYQMPQWQPLIRHADRMLASSLVDIINRDTQRYQKLSFRAGRLTLDLSRQRLDPAVVSLLIELASAAGLDDARSALFRHNQMNPTEKRAVLHTALRAPADQRPPEVSGQISQALSGMRRIVDAIRDGTWRGATGKAITQVIHLGIGGSYLAPAVALGALAHTFRQGPDIRFLVNIDGHELDAKLAGLDAERTLFVIVSKSMGTLETLRNAERCKSFLVERGIHGDSLAKHLIAITTNLEAAAKLGVASENVLPMWDWVGGRFSVWSAVGIPIALRFGFATFQRFLQGAHALDEHFRTAPLANNIPVLAALVELWNLAFLGAETTAVLAYDHRLRDLPQHLQQLMMESNGKRVHRDGTSVGAQTSPVVWGGEGTNGQHAYHQLLHQGTRQTHLEFIHCARADHRYDDHHRWLLANLAAQIEGLAAGDSNADPHREFPGNRGATVIQLDELSPETLGALLTLYEHRVFVQGHLWDINSFDQFGVELGKRLADSAYQSLTTGKVNPMRDNASRDAMQALIMLRSS